MTPGQHWPHALRVISDYHLTRRERDVAALLAQGLPYKVIANQLSIEKTSVAGHVGTILRKTNCDSRLQFALRFHGLLDG